MHGTKSLIMFKVVECKEQFVKRCFFEDMPVPKSVKVLICNEPLKRDCDIEGETICSTEYETGESNTKT
jgi:hypothetical protein